MIPRGQTRCGMPPKGAMAQTGASLARGASEPMAYAGIGSRKTPSAVFLGVLGQVRDGMQPRAPVLSLCGALMQVAQKLQAPLAQLSVGRQLDQPQV